MSTSKTFCLLPWSHFFTQPDGSVKVCCLASGALMKTASEPWSVRQDHPADIWNSEQFKLVRRTMLAGGEAADCRSCYDKERLGLGSRRIAVNEAYGASAPDVLKNHLVQGDDPLTAKAPTYFDLRLGNLCNLKCRMCSSDYSSQIERDPVAVKWSGAGGVRRIGDPTTDWPGAEDLFKRLEEFAIDAHRIELIGGEPTLNAAQLGLLKHFIANGRAHDIELHVISNMTNLRTGAFELFSQFKAPHIDASLDGVGTTYDYIRFPARWSAVSRNIEEVQRRFSSLSLSVHPTYQAYNILDVCSLFQWCLDRGLVTKTFNVLTHPRYLNIGILPENLREVAASRMERWVAERDLADGFRSGILDLASYVRDPGPTPPEQDVESFVQYTNDLDWSRGQDISVALPEFHELWCKSRSWDLGSTRNFRIERDTT